MLINRYMASKVLGARDADTLNNKFMRYGIKITHKTIRLPDKHSNDGTRMFTANHYDTEDMKKILDNNTDKRKYVQKSNENARKWIQKIEEYYGENK